MTREPIRALQIGMTSAAKNAGGVDRYYFNLIRSLAPLGIRTHGLVVGDRCDVVPPPGGRIECFAPDGSGLMRRWAGLRSAAGRALPESDVVVSHFAPYAFPILDRIRARPLIVHFHGPWALESAFEGAHAVTVAAKRVLERLVYRGGARFITLSRAFADIVANEYGVPRETIRIVPGGVDTARFANAGSRADARRALGWPVDRPTVVTVRRLVHAKGIERLIDATALVRARIPDVLVQIVGGGPLAADLQRRAAERGLGDSLRFAGYVDEAQLPLVYRAADLFVVPTIALEGFGLVVVEALACGTPVMVTPVAGLPEVVTALDPALVFASADARDIAAGIGAALAGALPLPADAACIAYARRFDWSAIAARVGDVYREVA